MEEITVKYFIWARAIEISQNFSFKFFLTALDKVKHDTATEIGLDSTLKAFSSLNDSMILFRNDTFQFETFKYLYCHVKRTVKDISKYLCENKINFLNQSSCGGCSETAGKPSVCLSSPSFSSAAD